MMEVILQAVRSYPVEIGGVVLHLSAWKAVGMQVLSEQGTAAGETILTASHPRGTRLTLEGKLAPAQDAGVVTAVLAAQLQSGVQEDVQLRGLVFPAARLCGYTISEAQGAAELTLQLYTLQCPVRAEEGTADV